MEKVERGVGNGVGWDNEGRADHARSGGVGA